MDLCDVGAAISQNPATSRYAFYPVPSNLMKALLTHGSCAAALEVQALNHLLLSKLPTALPAPSLTLPCMPKDHLPILVT